MVNLEIKILVVGPIFTNCYLVADKETNQVLILDAGAEPEKILSSLAPKPYTPVAILATHCHLDHIEAVTQLKRELKIPFLIPKGEEEILYQTIEIPPKPNGFLKGGDETKIGKVKFKVISTPGHTPGGISLYCQKEKVLFSGDTLFAGSIGRTDLPGGSEKEIKKSLRKLLQLPGDTLVFPGHGEKTTIEKEKETNPFCRIPTPPASNHLRRINR